MMALTTPRALMIVVGIMVTISLGVRELGDGGRDLRPCPSECRCTGYLIECWALSEGLYDYDLTESHQLVLNLDRKGYRQFPDLSRFEKSLSSLSLEGNNLTSFHGSQIQRFFKLHRLNLSRNMIDTIESIPDDKLPLQYLDLSHNHLQTLPSLGFNSMVYLEVLNLSYNMISNMHLASLYIPYEPLRVLVLHHNQLSVLQSDWLFGMTSLHELDLSYNFLPHLDFGLEGVLRNLKKLLLSRNQFSFLEHKMIETRRLEELYLDGNLIAEVNQETFSGLLNLKVLNLSANPLPVLPDLGSITSLEILDLSHCPFEYAGPNLFRGLTGLHSLFMRNSSLVTIDPAAFTRSSRWKKLVVTSSSIFCDCKLKQFQAWLVSTTAGTKGHDLRLTCNLPTRLHGRLLRSINESELKCVKYGKPFWLKTQPNETVYITLGEPLYMVCEAGDTIGTDVNITWTKQGGGVLSNTVHAVRVEDDVRVHYSRLEFIKVTTDVLGEYRCSANTHWKTEVSWSIRVSIYVAPAFKVVPKNTTVRAGQPTSVFCSVSGNPLPTVQFVGASPERYEYVDQGLRHQRFRMSIAKDGVTNLEILKPLAEDTGMFWCLGRGLKLDLIAPFYLSVEEAPRFRVTKREVMSQVGTCIVLNFDYVANPPPQLQMLKDDSPLVLTPRHVLNWTRLTICSVEPSDAGRYTCIASNSEGTSTFNVTLSVLKLFPGVSGSSGSGFFSPNKITILVVCIVTSLACTVVIWVIVIWFCRAKKLLFWKKVEGGPMQEVPGKHPIDAFFEQDLPLLTLAVGTSPRPELTSELASSAITDGEGDSIDFPMSNRSSGIEWDVSLDLLNAQGTDVTPLGSALSVDDLLSGLAYSARIYSTVTAVAPLKVSSLRSRPPAGEFGAKLLSRRTTDPIIVDGTSL